MKRLRSTEDLDSCGQKNNVGKDSVSNRNSSSSHRSFYYTSDSVRKGVSSSSARYDRDRSVDDEDRESMRLARKRSDHDFEGFDRRKGFDRFRDSSSVESRGYGSSSGGNRMAIHRSESFSVSRREFPKGFRSERDRPRREGSVSSWRRFGSGTKDFDERSRGGLEERGSSKSSPRVLRDAKSPSWSKDSGSEQSKVRVSPPPVSRGLREEKSKSKSPTLSKDSGSEQSKSVEVKKGEELQVKSGNTSEMEEGELEPEPTEAKAKPTGEVEAESDTVPEFNGERKAEDHDGLDDRREAEGESRVEDGKNEGMEDKAELLDKEDMDLKKEWICDEGKVVIEIVELPEFRIESVDESCGNENEMGNAGNDLGKEEESMRENSQCNKESNDNTGVEKSTQLGEEREQGKEIDLEVKAEVELSTALNDKEVSEEKEVCGAEMIEVGESSIQNFKDKGKSVAVVPFHVGRSEDSVWEERESSQYVETCKDNDIEGPTTRAFELFTSSPVRRQEKSDQCGDIKPKGEKLAFEPLDLSLSLPNVLLPSGASGDQIPAPGSPSQARSFQSLSNTFRTTSDGFTASMSFSGSQSFFHNPSCSLTQNSMENCEQSVHSRAMFQGIDQASSQGTWQGQSQNESKNKELPLYQRILMNGNASLQQPQVETNGQTVQVLTTREGSSRIANGLDRELSFHKQFSGQSKCNDDVRSPSQSVGSHDVGSNYSFEKKRIMREKSSSSLQRSVSIKEHDFVETVIARIVYEPVHEMAKKFNEITEQSIACVKESIRGITSNPEKLGQLYALQKALLNRSDMTFDALVKSHRAQLEILVALKTGLPDFLKHDSNVSSSDLAEIFMNLRCKNLTCRSPLPVDDCDCKVCAKKNGFCSTCMCVVCSKFDMASNTCSWVGCDICIHWCHVDCGLRELYIRNGCSDTGVQGTSEMQYHCVACDHPSEMFGFVKEVFQNCAKDWTAETLSRELKYVRRIFSASKDLRGKQLHGLADQLLARLTNKSNLPEVYGRIMDFFTHSDSSKVVKAPASSGKEQVNGHSGILGTSQETSWLKSVYSEKVLELEAPSRLPSFNYDQNNKQVMESEMPTSSQMEPLFDELDSIVRIKLAEAKMFQARADDARREAEGLKRIAVAKNKNIEEEYTSRISKLRLAEAEEIRKRKSEELQALERAHREYSSMKIRMEADIKDLLLKMEATKRNLV